MLPLVALLLKQVVVEVGTAAVNALAKVLTKPREPEPPHKPEPPHLTWKGVEHQREQERASIAQSKLEQVDRELGAVGKRR